jgi:hypothetical protein
MHIHGNQANLSGTNPYSAAAEKAVASKRASGVRKKLMKSAINPERPAGPEESSLLAKWMETNPAESRDEVEIHASTSGKDSDFG